MPIGLDDFELNYSQIAHDDFDIARRKSFWHSVRSWLGQHTNELLPFEDVVRQLPLRGQHYIGLLQVPIDQIVGSLSRYNDFDREFLPRQTHTRDRWENIDKAHLREVILPPIELYKMGEMYFVKDGNHRVSVARERGQVFIDAQVIEIDTPVELKSNLELRDLTLKKEQADFIQQTKLADILPDVKIDFTIPDQYHKLREHIRVHRWYMGEKLHHEINEADAIAGWYDEVYMPLMRVVRQKQILKEFPGRTEADLYLWIIEHRYYLMEELNIDVSLEKAAVHFVNTFSQRTIAKRIKVLFIQFKRIFRRHHQGK
jgi:hypothetical protein